MRYAWAIIAGLALVACSGPQRPHGPPLVQFSRGTLPVPSESLAASEAGNGGHVPSTMVVAAIWSSEAAVPLGGQYDYAQKGTKPLATTYDFPNIEVPVWEAFAARLRHWGFRLYKDYSDVGNPTLIKPPGKQAVVLRGHVRSAVHDQLRGNDPARPGVQAAWLEVDLELTNTRGNVLWKDRRSAKIKVLASSKTDVLDALGRSIADGLAKSDEFLAVLASSRPLRSAGKGAASR